MTTQEEGFFKNLQFFTGQKPCPASGLFIESFLEHTATVGDVRALLSGAEEGLIESLLPVRRQVHGRKVHSLFGKDRDEARRMASDDVAAGNYLRVVRAFSVAFLGLRADEATRRFDLRRDKKDKPVSLDENWTEKYLELFLESLSDMGYECLRKQILTFLYERLFAQPFEDRRPVPSRVLHVVGRWFYTPQKVSSVPTSKFPASLAVSTQEPPADVREARTCLLRNASGCQCARFFSPWTAENCEAFVSSTPSSATSSMTLSSGTKLPPAIVPGSSTSTVSSYQAGEMLNPKIVLRGDFDDFNRFRCLCDPQRGRNEPPLASVTQVKWGNGNHLLFRCATCPLKSVSDVDVLSGKWRRPPLCQCSLFARTIEIDKEDSTNHGKKVYVCRYHPKSECPFEELVPDPKTNPKRGAWGGGGTKRPFASGGSGTWAKKQHL